MLVTAIEDEIDELTKLILAAENWSPVYAKSPETHARIIKVEAKISRVVRKYFRELANDRVGRYVNWVNYHIESIKAWDINVIFDDAAFSNSENSLMLGVVHDPLLAGMGTGIAAGQEIYNRDIGMSTSSARVLDSARNYSAQLVKGVNDTTRDRIRQSITTSLTMGEDTKTAAARLRSIVNDSKRADVIARTEAVNSYTKGLLAFANESNATGKVWQAVNPDDECADLDGVEVGINEDFPGDGGDGPPLHPNCRCGVQITYPTGDEGDNSDSSDDFSDDNVDEGDDDFSAASSSMDDINESGVGDRINLDDVGADDTLTAFHGEGHNLSNGNYALGDAYYVTRDAETASEFGDVSKVQIPLKPSEILTLNTQEDYQNIVSEAIRTYPGVNFNQALPKLILSKGYKAIEMSPAIDPLGGIAVIDPDAIAKIQKLK